MHLGYFTKGLSGKELYTPLLVHQVDGFQIGIDLPLSENLTLAYRYIGLTEVKSVDYQDMELTNGSGAQMALRYQKKLVGGFGFSIGGSASLMKLRTNYDMQESSDSSNTGSEVLAFRQAKIKLIGGEVSGGLFWKNRYLLVGVNVSAGLFASTTKFNSWTQEGNWGLEYKDSGQVKSRSLGLSTTYLF